MSAVKNGIKYIEAAAYNGARTLTYQITVVLGKFQAFNKSSLLFEK